MAAKATSGDWATVKLIVPLVLFIFPELLVILLGPAMMSILDVLKDVSAK